ncbi:MAG: ArsR/SmtB family transcription factor [Gemmobacter sp.]
MSNVTRLRILKELAAAGPGDRCAGDLAAAVGASPSRASFHLSNLAAAGLITSSQTARQVTYRADFETVGAMIRYFMDDRRPGQRLHGRGRPSEQPAFSGLAPGRSGL